jgi:hypothetical protein
MNQNELENAIEHSITQIQIEKNAQRHMLPLIALILGIIVLQIFICILFVTVKLALIISIYISPLIAAIIYLKRKKKNIPITLLIASVYLIFTLPFFIKIFKTQKENGLKMIQTVAASSTAGYFKKPEQTIEKLKNQFQKKVGNYNLQYVMTNKEPEINKNANFVKFNVLKENKLKPIIGTIIENTLKTQKEKFSPQNCHAEIIKQLTEKNKELLKEIETVDDKFNINYIDYNIPGYMYNYFFYKN